MRTPLVTIRLVDWADEEARGFGRSLLGSSAACGPMRDQDELRSLRDRDGVALPDALAAHDVELDRMSEARQGSLPPPPTRAAHRAGPRAGIHVPALVSVLGTFGVERHRVTFRGQAAHAGSTPMSERRDALAGAALLELEIREIARRTGAAPSARWGAS